MFVKYQRRNTHTKQKDTTHAMQYKAKQSKQSKDQKRAKGVGVEEPQCKHLTIT